ncbi:predicted protein, partial [Nematostella vectensis]
FVTGVAGNLLVMIVSIMNSFHKTTANIFILNLAVADLLASCGFAFMLSSLLQGEWPLGDFACKLHGVLVMAFSVASSLSASAMSINRYTTIIYASKQKSITFTRNWTKIMLAFLWLFSAIFAILPLVGWSRYTYFPAKAICFISYTESRSYIITFYTLVAPCCLVTIFCYSRIYIAIKKNSPMRVASPSQKRKPSPRKPDSNSAVETRVTIMIFVVVFWYFTSLAPFNVINLMVIWKPGFQIPPWVDILTTLFALSNHATNVFIYAVLNRTYR